MVQEECERQCSLTTSRAVGSGHSPGGEAGNLGNASGHVGAHSPHLVTEVGRMVRKVGQVRVMPVRPVDCSASLSSTGRMVGAWRAWPEGGGGEGIGMEGGGGHRGAGVHRGHSESSSGVLKNPLVVPA